MGWPNADPEGWDRVCREAVEEWLHDEARMFFDSPITCTRELVEMLQAEHEDLFAAILMKVPMDYIGGATHDYWLAKYGGED